MKQQDKANTVHMGLQVGFRVQVGCDVSCVQQRSWVDQQGQKRSVVEVVADRLQGLDRREDGAGGPGGGGRDGVLGSGTPASDANGWKP